MLEEMRHSFDTVYLSVKKYTTKTFTVFGAELTMLLFYMNTDELSKLKVLFSEKESGWYIFAALAAMTFIISATLFVLTLATDRRWCFPPKEQKLVENLQYKKMSDEQLMQELISEYSDSIDYCIKKIHRMKILSDVGTYFLISGVFCLLIIKIFGV